MTIQWSDTVRNARGDAVFTALGAGWKLKIRTGAPPANVATASSGTLLATFTPTAGASAAGVKNLATDAPTTVAAGAAGTAGHYELTTSADVVHERGTVTATGGGGDVTIDNTVIANGQSVKLNSWTRTESGA